MKKKIAAFALSMLCLLIGGRLRPKARRRECGQSGNRPFGRNGNHAGSGS